MTPQLAFSFPHQDSYDPAAFIAGAANAEALEWLEGPERWPNLRLAVHGDAGSGKTHLLHWFAARFGARLLRGGNPGDLALAPPTSPIAIDDADGSPDPEALLHLLNYAAESHYPVLLAARTPPARWAAALPDLDSRLRATTAVRLGQPDDALLRALLARLIAERQLRVDAPTQDYLLARLPRSGRAMREAAARLDRASLESARGVTRSLAAQVLREMQIEIDPGTAQDEDLRPTPIEHSHGHGSLL